MIQSKWVFGEGQAQEAFKIRRKVFIDEMGLSEDVHFDEYENRALHLLIGEDDTWLATGKLYEADKKFYIGGIAVLPEIRGKKIGDLLIRVLLNKAFELLADKVYVHARLSAVDFYKKLNFEVCSDEYELEPGDKRLLMVVTKENSPLSHSCSDCSSCGRCQGSH